MYNTPAFDLDAILARLQSRREFLQPFGKGLGDTTLAATLSAGDGKQVLDLLAAHPATARFIATRLCRRFIREDPDPAIVCAAAAAFMQSGGDIKTTLRARFAIAAFRSGADRKLCRPTEYLAGSWYAPWRRTRLIPPTAASCCCSAGPSWASCPISGPHPKVIARCAGLLGRHRRTVEPLAPVVSVFLPGDPGD